METTNEMPLGDELAEEEDPNISNLLVSKSERAPVTEAVPPLKEEKFSLEPMKTVAVGVLLGAAVTFVIMLARRLGVRHHSGREM
jgi:hypothetical protein